MKTVMISCEMLKNELSAVIEKTGIHYPVVWISSEYHNSPETLRAKLQSEIDKCTSCERILLAFGCCGNATVGLKATTADLIIPKADDCIDILLKKEHEVFERKARTYFLSKSWLESPNNLLNEYDRMLNRYGEVRAKKLFRMMFNAYRYIMYIDTGLSDFSELSSLLETSQQIASMLDLELIVEKGNDWLLEKLVSEPYDCNLNHVKKGEIVTLADF